MKTQCHHGRRAPDCEECKVQRALNDSRARIAALEDKLAKVKEEVRYAQIYAKMQPPRVASIDIVCERIFRIIDAPAS